MVVVPIPIKDTNYSIPSSDAYYVSPDGKETILGNNPASPWPVAKFSTQPPKWATIVFRHPPQQATASAGN